MVMGVRTQKVLVPVAVVVGGLVSVDSGSSDGSSSGVTSVTCS